MTERYVTRRDLLALRAWSRRDHRQAMFRNLATLITALLDEINQRGNSLATWRGHAKERLEEIHRLEARDNVRRADAAEEELRALRIKFIDMRVRRRYYRRRCHYLEGRLREAGMEVRT